MLVYVSGHHLVVTPAIRRYVQSKLQRVRRHFGRVIGAHVILSAQRARQKAEATLHLRGKELHCECVRPDLYAAIDLLADKLDRQVLRHKGKRNRRRGLGL